MSDNQEFENPVAMDAFEFQCLNFCHVLRNINQLSMVDIGKQTSKRSHVIA
jgi:hypothetical protein